MGGGMSKVFGKMNPDATNSMLDGKVVATGTPGASEVDDPNEGLNYGNRLARGLVGGLGNGLRQQYGNRQQQGWSRGNPYTPTFEGINPSMLSGAPQQNNWTGQPNGQPVMRVNRNPLFGE